MDLVAAGLLGQIAWDTYHRPEEAGRGDLPYWSRFDADHQVLSVGREDRTCLESPVRSAEPVRAHLFGDRYVDGHHIDGPWDTFFSGVAGRPLRLVRTSDPSGGFDLHPVTLLSEASVAALRWREGRRGTGSTGLPALDQLRRGRAVRRGRLERYRAQRRLGRAPDGRTHPAVRSGPTSPGPVRPEAEHAAPAARGAWFTAERAGPHAQPRGLRGGPATGNGLAR